MPHWDHYTEVEGDNPNITSEAESLRHHAITESWRKWVGHRTVFGKDFGREILLKLSQINVLKSLQPKLCHFQV